MAKSWAGTSRACKGKGATQLFSSMWPLPGVLEGLSCNALACIFNQHDAPCYASAKA